MREVTYENWLKNPTPRLMWVWDEDEELKVKRKVVYVLKDGVCTSPVLVVVDEYIYDTFRHCAETEKQRRMTNKELAWWLSEKPHRELKIRDYIYHDYDYKENEQDAEVEDLVLIRENDGEWREPLVDYNKR